MVSVSHHVLGMFVPSSLRYPNLSVVQVRNALKHCHTTSVCCLKFMD